MHDTKEVILDTNRVDIFAKNDTVHDYIQLYTSTH